MAIEKQIETALHGLATRSECTVEHALQVLHEDIPGVAFPEVVVHRDRFGKPSRLEVCFFDEVHDPSMRRVAVDLTKPG